MLNFLLSIFHKGRGTSDPGVSFSIKSPSFHQLVKSLQSRYKFEIVEDFEQHILLQSPEFPFMVYLANLKGDYLLMKWQFKQQLPQFVMIKREERTREKLEQRTLQELFFGNKNLDRTFIFDGDLKSDFAAVIRSQEQLINRLKVSIRSIRTHSTDLEFQVLLSIRTVEDIIHTLGSSKGLEQYK